MRHLCRAGLTLEIIREAEERFWKAEREKVRIRKRIAALQKQFEESLADW